HIVPRWGGDTNFFPLIARTKAIPELLSEARSRIAANWQG
ncbi:MAG: HIT family hydrolase, partial [Varibaculum timonense]